MRSPSIPGNEAERLAALRSAFSAYAPREDRFDRITRMAARLLRAPIAAITIIEEKEQWFRSVQGLDIDSTPRDVSFCGHVVADGRPLVVTDTWKNPDFFDNPLVTSNPGIRAYAGFPLEIAPNVYAGTVCIMDTVPRKFSEDELQSLLDLARIAEGELRAGAMFRAHRTMLARLELAQRRDSIDPTTGCWTPGAFRRLVSLALRQARQASASLALCHVATRPRDPDAPVASPGQVAQALRHLLPLEASLAHLEDGQFSALVTAAAPRELERRLGPLKQETLAIALSPDRTVELSMATHIVRPEDLPGRATANQLWAACIAAGHSTIRT